jgi:2-methylcitrate dehydratase PrpD
MNDIALDVAAAKTGLTLSHQLARHAIATPYEAIPQASLEAAKLFMLDTLAVAWAGSDAPGCREAHALLVDEGGRADSTVWCHGERLPAMAAAFLNSMAASALDYDSIGRAAAVHVNIAVLPAVLAVAQRQRASGKDFLAALTIGADIMYRIGAAAAKPNRGFHYTGVFGGFGAAAGAARLLGLGESAAGHALGIAFMQASGTQQANVEPSLCKRTLSAFAARAGVYAALLAQRGLTAPKEAFEGRFGLYALYQEGDRGKLTDALGTRFDNTGFAIKLYPSCGCNHTTIDGMLDLVGRYDLKPDDVLSVELTVPPYIDRLVGGTYDPSADAQVAAQFNIRYTVACVLVRRRLGLEEISEKVARDPEIAKHIGKVSVKVDPAQTRNRGPVAIRVKTRNHGELTTRVEDVRGGPDAPITEADAQAKFQECFKLGVRPLTDARIDALSRRVRELESVDDMSAFFAGIIPARRRRA